MLVSLFVIASIAKQSSKSSTATGLFRLWLAMTSVGLVFAQELSLEDRIYSNEAEINILKSEINSLKDVATQERANAFNPSISLSVDILGQHGFGIEKEHEHDHDHKDHDHKHEFKNGLLIREAELEFKAAIDPFAEGLVSIAIEQESYKKFNFHLEEAYAKASFLGLNVKLGRFRADFGRMNKIHLHALPQISYPYAIKNFLGEEGFFGNGLSISYNWAVSQNQALVFSLEGFLSSITSRQDKGAENYPSALARVWWHSQYGDSNYLDVGISNFFGAMSKKKEGGFFDLLGFDLHYSYKPSDLGAEALFLFGHESFFANNISYGNFTWAQLRLFASTFFGVRYDLNQGEKHLFSHAISAYLSYYTSEFLRFRLGYEHFMPELSSLNGDHRLMLSIVFTIGSHPQDPYIVNR